jgi:hypothetical protein
MLQNIKTPKKTQKDTNEILSLVVVGTDAKTFFKFFIMLQNIKTPKKTQKDTNKIFFVCCEQKQQDF